MSIHDDLLDKSKSLCVVGLGYVGFPIAYAFATKGVKVIAYDNNSSKINMFCEGIDPTNEVGRFNTENLSIQFTSEKEDLKKASFFIVAVPTPINQDHTPNLQPVTSACKDLGKNLQKGSIVVFESTVYPGVTEDICIPILEKESNLVCGEDFKVGYSPERINPGDKVHRLNNIVKIVSGMDHEALSEIKETYEIVIEAGTFPVSSIRVAEAIKVVENSQRDINIAFMNELAMVFDRMDIDTNEVVKGMNTKWNALGFTPGLVGGHCIGVDPYYFIYQAERLGYHSQIILSGRKINDGMGEFVADVAIKKLILSGLAPKNSKVVIFGITFKENCNDIRNSKVEDIILRLREYGIDPLIVDPWADQDDVEKYYGLNLIEFKDIFDADCLIFAVGHNEFKNYSPEVLAPLFKQSNEFNIICDVKGIFSGIRFNSKKYIYWSL